jgi:hypothetical protein
LNVPANAGSARNALVTGKTAQIAAAKTGHAVRRRVNIVARPASGNAASLVLPKHNVLAKRGNRSKVGFYQHFRREARALVASVQHAALRQVLRRQVVERLQVVFL